jgi:type IV pilus assembly protein PilO
MSFLNKPLDFGGVFAQFRSVRERHPAFWPTVPQLLLFTMIFAATLAVAWAAYWRGQLEELEAGEIREQRLRAEYVEKLKQAVNLPALRKQKEQVSSYVLQLEKQLPNAAEMDALLSDINQAGVGRKLTFELFKPGEVVLRDYYAELPIKITLSGRFVDVAAFASDVSNLARIVTLNDVDLRLPELKDKRDPKERAGMLLLDATAKTYRYLDPSEVSKARRDAAKARKPGAPGAPPAAGAQGARP